MKLEHIQAEALAHCMPALLEEAAASRRRRPEEFAFTLRAAAPGADAAGLFEPQNCRGRRFEAHVGCLRLFAAAKKRAEKSELQPRSAQRELAPAPNEESIRVARKTLAKRCTKLLAGGLETAPE